MAIHWKRPSPSSLTGCGRALALHLTEDTSAVTCVTCLSLVLEDVEAALTGQAIHRNFAILTCTSCFDASFRRLENALKRAEIPCSTCGGSGRVKHYF